MGKKRTKNREILLGAHMSIAGGVDRAIVRGDSIGCTAIQIFLKNNTQWKKNPPITPAEQKAFFQRQEETGLRTVFAHSAYLINLASANSTTRRRSREALIDEARRASLLKIPFVVFHPGSHGGQGEEVGIHRITDEMNRVFRRTAKLPVALCLETTAGQGHSVGHRFEHLAEIMDGVEAPPERVGVCFDTCHVFAAGYDIRTRKGYNSTMKLFDDTVGLHRLLAFHLNDSKRELGSRVDRHEHIGRGLLGLEPFRLLLNDRRFERIPFVLETPKEPDLEEDRENLEVIRNLIGQKRVIS